MAVGAAASSRGARSSVVGGIGLAAGWMEDEDDILVVVDGLGCGLGHLGHSLRAFAEGFGLERQGYGCCTAPEGVGRTAAKIAKVCNCGRRLRLGTKTLEGEKKRMGASDAPEAGG